ncbi:MAG: IS5 family transposase [Waterburya sp.]
MTYKKISKLEVKEFKRLCGVKPEVFAQMVEVLKPKLPKLRQRGGQPKLRVEDQLLITLEYWREYRTYFHIGQSWGVHESTVCRIVHRVENILIKSKQFSLPGKKTLLSSPTELQIMIVDVGESPIERPQKKQRNYYSGKKKRHTLKFQLIIEADNLKIICTAHGTGKEHDFKLFKRSNVKLLSQVEILADKGYQGIKKIHDNSYTPKKQVCGKSLTATERKYNRELAKQRIYIEHVIHCLKIFRILAQPYRNRRRRFGLRFNLIAALYTCGLEAIA